MDLRELKTVLLWGLITTFIISTGCSAKKSKVPYYRTPNFTPYWLGKVPGSFHRIAHFETVDQEGNPVSDADFKNSIYVANFFFTGCAGICPKMTRHMKLVADSFVKDKRVKFISYSVDPERDSPARLGMYAEQYNIDARQWHLVTGNKAAIYELARKSYFAEEDIGFNKDSTEFLHTEHFMLVDREGHLRGLYNGTVALEMQRLRDDIQILLDE